MKKTILIWIWFAVVIVSIIFGYFTSWYFDKKEKSIIESFNNVISDTMIYIEPSEDIVEIKRVGNNLLKIKYDIETKIDSVILWYEEDIINGRCVCDTTWRTETLTAVFSAETTVIPIVTKIENAEPITYYSGDKLIYKEVK